MIHTRFRPKRGKHRLKPLRVTVAFIAFTCLCLVFLDIHGALPPFLGEAGLFFQFIPALVQAVGNPDAGWGGVVTVLVLTLVLGRIYCSTLCPLGILMDLAAWIKRRLGWKTAHVYAPPHPWIRYSLLGATVAAFAGGAMVVVSLLDPFSHFGRLASTLARPAVVAGNNGLVRVLEAAGRYDISPVKAAGLTPGLLLFTLGVLALILGLTFTRGRFYCQTICPVGTFLGLWAKLAPFKIRLDARGCIHCKACSRVCKSECIDLASGTVDADRCVVCFNCLTVCPAGAMDFGLPLKPGVETPAHTGRRSFLAATALALVPRTSRGSQAIQVTVPNTIPVPKHPHPILPPGSVSLDRFTANCTACHACIAHCPAHVLQPSMTQYGLAGLFMPFLDPASGFCNLNCTACSDVCPTQAITPFTKAEKKQIQTGEVVFIRDNCSVLLQGTDCGACSEHCPTKAVTMVREGRVRVPRVHPEICLGCGACEHVCPAKPHKAIYVRPHTVQQRAQLPPEVPAALPAPGGTTDFGF